MRIELVAGSATIMPGASATAWDPGKAGDSSGGVPAGDAETGRAMARGAAAGTLSPR